MKKVILHLCADIGSDSYPYACDDDYQVILIGERYGVQNVTRQSLLRDYGTATIHGIIANPVCTDLSRARRSGKAKDIEKGLFLVRECERVIKELQPQWWVIENPASGVLRDYLGKPMLTYQPYEYGSGWTKKTALWGNFRLPEKTHTWETCPKITGLYVRNGGIWVSRRTRYNRPSLAIQHKNAIRFIKEFEPFASRVLNDADLRSLCSQNFAKAFKAVNP